MRGHQGQAVRVHSSDSVLLITLVCGVETWPNTKTGGGTSHVTEEERACLTKG